MGLFSNSLSKRSGYSLLFLRLKTAIATRKITITADAKEANRIKSNGDSKFGSEADVIRGDGSGKASSVLAK